MKELNRVLGLFVPEPLFWPRQIAVFTCSSLSHLSSVANPHRSRWLIGSRRKSFSAAVVVVKRFFGHLVSAIASSSPHLTINLCLFLLLLRLLLLCPAPAKKQRNGQRTEYLSDILNSSHQEMIPEFFFFFSPWSPSNEHRVVGAALQSSSNLVPPDLEHHRQRGFLVR